jgi:phosphatidylserine/phosphatidylglycerophosphate/cardiolipin synthase-like enzyme
VEVRTWFLSAQERGYRLPAWSGGDAVRALVDGAVYFTRLAEEVEALQAGDHLFFTDWRGDADQRVGPTGPTIGDLFCAAARRGVVVKSLMWRYRPVPLPARRRRAPR